ncbi:phosphoglycerate mutase-like protein AT74 isoform X3 [Nicotiana tomentosiformis]|uniref:phosphoglycerate mutase-like protein AT74 isoform X3 n=1 Tax=Nicotiana tomentosiformis TaxID=4098 RepID=UPI00051C80ED|nr:phosphoglycerate mutase-like protein AT74 isoform X3 [Nicotiana tomentosiformis]
MSNLFSKIYPTSFGVNHQKLHPNSSTIRCCNDEYSGVQHKSTELNGWVSSFPEKNLVLSYPGIVKPPRPKRIILVRHGQSEGNVDESVYTRVADPNVGLTEKGVEEAEECGRKMREMIEKDGGDDWKVYFYVSPYKRGIETLRNLAKSFERSRIAGVREEPRLREQDFGNFQDKEQMKIEKAVRARYGRFFYRFPNGESAADVYDRITVEQFEGLHNMSNGGMIVMERGYGGRYCLSVHHTREELQKFGMTDEMLIDQEWQKIAKPGELNYDCLITGPSYFTHFDDDEDKNFEL